MPSFQGDSVSSQEGRWYFGIITFWSFVIFHLSGSWSFFFIESISTSSLKVERLQSKKKLLGPLLVPPPKKSLSGIQFNYNYTIFTISYTICSKLLSISLKQNTDCGKKTCQHHQVIQVTSWFQGSLVLLIGDCANSFRPLDAWKTLNLLTENGCTWMSSWKLGSMVRISGLLHPNKSHLKVGYHLLTFY